MIINAATALVLMQQLVTQPVPRADYLVVMDTEYQAMDLDGDGAVTAQEIAQRQSQAQAQQIVEANRQIFTNLDTNQDGMLSPDEFLKLAAAPQAADPAPTMQRLDLDRDGSVSLVEHRTVMLATFDALDMDKDGVVTPAEAEAGQQARASAEGR